MDLLSLIQDTDLYNLHTHTQFCDGHADMEDFVHAAQKYGYHLLGFTPHSPIPFASPCNMDISAVDAYFDEISRLRTKYPDVKILAGMEIDYIGDDWGPASPYFKRLGLDYSIGSVHFIPTKDNSRHVDIDGRFEQFKQKMDNDFDNDIEYVVSKFFEQSIAMAQKGGFDIIGHFDKIKHNAGNYKQGIDKSSFYDVYVEKLINAIIKGKYIVEINTKAWEKHGHMFPDQRHWRHLIDAGVPLIVNSDAHYPELLPAARQSALKSVNYLKRQLNNINV